MVNRCGLKEFFRLEWFFQKKFHEAMASRIGKVITASQQNTQSGEAYSNGSCLKGVSGNFVQQVECA